MMHLTAITTHPSWGSSKQQTSNWSIILSFAKAYCKNTDHEIAQGSRYVEEQFLMLFAAAALMAWWVLKGIEAVWPKNICGQQRASIPWQCRTSWRNVLGHVSRRCYYFHSLPSWANPTILNSIHLVCNVLSTKPHMHISCFVGGGGQQFLLSQCIARPEKWDVSQVGFPGSNASRRRIVLLPGACRAHCPSKMDRFWVHLFYSVYFTILQSFAGHAFARRVSHKPCFGQVHCSMQIPLHFLPVLPKSYMRLLPHLGFSEGSICNEFSSLVLLIVCFVVVCIRGEGCPLQIHRPWAQVSSNAGCRRSTCCRIWYLPRTTDGRHGKGNGVNGNNLSCPTSLPSLLEREQEESWRPCPSTESDPLRVCQRCRNPSISLWSRNRSYACSGCACCKKNNKLKRMHTFGEVFGGIFRFMRLSVHFLFVVWCVLAPLSNVNRPLQGPRTPTKS